MKKWKLLFGLMFLQGVALAQTRSVMTDTNAVLVAPTALVFRTANDIAQKSVVDAALDGKLDTDAQAADVDPAGTAIASALAEKRDVMDYISTWNAETNSPALADGTGTLGDIYFILGATSQTFNVDLGSGTKAFAGGRYVRYDGAEWQPLTSTEEASSTLLRLWHLDSTTKAYAASLEPKNWIVYPSLFLVSSTGVADGYPANDGVVFDVGGGFQKMQIFAAIGGAMYYRTNQFASQNAWTSWNQMFNLAGTDLAITDGGTGASDAATARTNLGAADATDVLKLSGTDQTVQGVIRTSGGSALGTTARGQTAVAVGPSGDIAGQLRDGASASLVLESLRDGANLILRSQVAGNTSGDLHLNDLAGKVIVGDDGIQALSASGLLIQDSTGTTQATVSSSGLTYSTGNVTTLSWEGATADDFETTLTAADPTADRTLILPDASGTLLTTTGDGSQLTGVVTVQVQDYRLGFFGSPLADDLDWLLVAEPVEIKSASPGVAYARTAADAETTFDVLKNGVSIGSVVFAAAGQTGTVTITSDTTFAAGDRLEFEAPTSPDADLAHIQLVLIGELQ